MFNQSVIFWLAAAAAVLLIGVSKGGFGGGIGVIATPLLALVIPVAEAAALLLPILILADVVALRHYWRHVDRHNMGLLLPGALLGILIGALFFGYFSRNEAILKAGLGILAILFVLFQLLRQTIIRTAAKKLHPTFMLGTVVGTVAGFTSTLAHVGGPPITIYLLPQELPRQIFVGTFVLFFAIVNVVKLIPYGLLGILEIGDLPAIVVLSPLVFIGSRLGIYLNQHFTDRLFNRVIYLLLLATGIQLLLGQSLLSLLMH